jgi:hypothetical protein
MRRIITTIMLAITLSSCSAEPKADKMPINKPVVVIPEDQKDPIEDKERFCRDEKGNVQQGLIAAYQLYQTEKSPKSIKLLVDVDRKIRTLLKARPTYRPCKDDKDIYDPAWKEMGVHLGYWVDLVYTGDLLYRAHQRNPYSPLRKHTLFSTIMGIKEPNLLGLMPNIKAAHRYVKEFPRGPFIEEAHWLIAGFYKDLYMVLRDSLQDYKYDCFKPYINQSATALQARRAREKASANYQTILKLNPANADAAQLLSEVQRGTVKAWSFCAD